MLLNLEDCDEVELCREGVKILELMLRLGESVGQNHKMDVENERDFDG